MKPAPHARKVPLGLRIIAAGKLFKSTMLAGIAFGIFHYLHSDIGEAMEHFVRRLHIDPNKEIIDEILSKISGLRMPQLEALGTGTLTYSILYFIEAWGLWRGRHWAEYLVIVITGLLVPLEIYELAQKLSWLRLLVLGLNLAAVAYLIWRLRKDKQLKTEHIQQQNAVKMPPV